MTMKFILMPLILCSMSLVASVQELCVKDGLLSKNICLMKGKAAVLATAEAKLRCGKSLEAIKENFSWDSRKFLPTIRQLSKEKQDLAKAVFSQGGELLTWISEHFEDLLNPSNTLSVEEAEPEDYGKDTHMPGRGHQGC